jgi:hypothetical protein
MADTCVDGVYEPKQQLLVPRIVERCTDYLKKHGMHTIGLFRVAGSARRCRQMRVELDSGQEVGVEWGAYAERGHGR